MSGYTGISYPFRLNTKGGVAMSTTTPTNPQHVEEGIKQYLGTRLGERVMESIGSELLDYVFDPQDESTYDMIRYEAIKCLESYEGVTIVEEDTTVYGVDGKIIIELHYTIDKYEETFVTTITV